MARKWQAKNNTAIKQEVKNSMTAKTKMARPENFDLKSNEDSAVKSYFESFEFEFGDPEGATISKDIKTKKLSGSAKKAQVNPMDELDELPDKTMFPEGRYASIWKSPKLRNKGGLVKAPIDESEYVPRPLDYSYEDKLVTKDINIEHNYEITYDAVPEEAIQDNDDVPEESDDGTWLKSLPKHFRSYLYAYKQEHPEEAIQDNDDAPEESDDDTLETVPKSMNKILPAYLSKTTGYATIKPEEASLKHDIVSSDQHNHDTKGVGAPVKLSSAMLQKLSELAFAKSNKKTHI